MTQAEGTFYGVGVGPGDPELLTLKARRVIAASPIVAYPASAEGESMARRITDGIVSATTMELPIRIPMRTERAPAQAVYDGAAETIASHLRAGRDVAFLCEGDPFFYGSFMYLFPRIAAAHRTEIIPGVTSLTACAGALGRPLAARNEVFKVLPAPLAAERLRAELLSTDAAAIIKVGRHFDKVRAVLRELGLAGRAAIVEAATSPEQRVSALEDLAEGERPYFSTILVYKGDEGW